MDRTTFLEAWASLSDRQEEALRLLADGNGNDEIATAMSIVPATVELHRRHGMAKFKLAAAGKPLSVYRFIALWWRYVGLDEVKA